MSAEPSFAQAGATPLYWLDPATRITGYLAKDAAALGPSPTLTATWGDAGTYLLFGQPVADADAFLPALEAYLAAFFGSGAPRFLWILDPAQGYLTWTTQDLTVAAGATAGTTIVARRVDLAFADNTLIVRSGGTIAPADNGDAGWGFALGDSAGAGALAFYTTNGQFNAASGTASLCMADASAGCWRARFDVAAPAGGTDGFVLLGCAIRFFTPRPTTGEVHAIDFQVLRQPDATAFSLYANLDAQRPLAGDRSAFGFFGWGGTGTAPTLQSGYATAKGYAVDLTPQASSAPGFPAARLVFAVAPFYATEAPPYGYYLTPEGGYSLNIVDPEDLVSGIERLICGASALEYLGLPSASGSALLFVGGQPAFAQPPSDGGTGSLTSLGTTAWAYAVAPSGQSIRYFAQPEDAPLYAALSGGVPVAAALAEDDAPPFLDFLEVSACSLAAPAPQLAFPMAPFRDIPPDMLDDARTIERIALAPMRRALLSQMALQGGSVPEPAPPETPEERLPAAATVGVTPQGMAVGIDSDGQSWLWAALGQTAASGAEPDLRFTSVRGALRQALLTNNLFMVLGNAQLFNTAGSVEYQLTALDLDVIATLPPELGVPPAVLANVRAYMVAQGYPTYIDLAHFQAALVAADAGITAEQMAVFQRYAGLLSPVVDGWTFRLSPDNWTVPGRAGQTNAYVIYKFNLGRSLADMAADVSSWTWPAAASPTGDPRTASADILQIIAKAASRQGESGALYNAFNAIVTDPNWSGILALSVEVPLDQLPGPLQPLAAGIDPSAFYAHHVGIAATPYQLLDQGLDFGRSTLFGLIDYENEEDQYFSDEIAFAFRVLQLSVGFQNSVVSTFASRVELLINRLFGAPARLFPTVHGNNIILTGAHQVQTLPDGTRHDTYVFAMAGENSFSLDGLILQSVQLISTDMVTTRAASQAGGATVTATFRMAGNLRFYEPPLFDPFCWGEGADGIDGYLRFGNLSIDMAFELGDPVNTTVFRLNDGALSFDLSNSVARPDSLARRFPVRLTNLITTPDPRLAQPIDTDPGGAALMPQDMGFISVTAPIDQGLLSAPWYGLNYTIDLGTLGALAGSASIALSVLAAWSPGPGGQEPNVYVGVKLPGTREAFGVNLPLQGILKLGFRSIEFLVDNTDGEPRTYTLRLRDFALRLLGLSFPPGHNDIVLFGNPDQGSTDKVGWYAAYSQEKSKSGAGNSRVAARAAQSQSRLLARPPAEDGR
ncbi:hemagglutinin protein [Sphingomonas suaedae]|uniref:Hemagglutinin protein n=1 Tax=Sphingomonas suaedae TaxID=2599297 RepID=A0A518RFF2_9SPHN|nr:hemagglutinin protein [Sphingomonas suaedae]QDX26144.1 hemagglutinin protein [Sphingomonas suaedae]